MMVGNPITQDKILDAMGNIIADGSTGKDGLLEGYKELGSDGSNSSVITGSTAKGDDTIYQISFDRKAEPKQGVDSLVTSYIGLLLPMMTVMNRRFSLLTQQPTALPTSRIILKTLMVSTSTKRKFQTKLPPPKRKACWDCGAKPLLPPGKKPAACSQRTTLA